MFAVMRRDQPPPLQPAPPPPAAPPEPAAAASPPVDVQEDWPLDVHLPELDEDEEC